LPATRIRRCGKSGVFVSSLILAAVLFGALLHAIWNALIKAQPDRFGAAMLVAIGAGMIGVPAILYFPPPPAAAWPYMVASSVIHVGYFALVGFAYRHADLGVAYPLTRGSAPLVTAILAYLLIGEALPWNGWLAPRARRPCSTPASSCSTR
jgi:drug/metabolite transporter (DMT)-like permease